MRPWLLSKNSSTDARPIALRSPAPLKITSCIDSPRSADAFDSPRTQRTASMTFDLPQPLGPTMPTSWPGVAIDVGSTNDLKPASLICVRRKGDLRDSCERGRSPRARRTHSEAAKKLRNYSGGSTSAVTSSGRRAATGNRLDLIDDGRPVRSDPVVELRVDVIALARRDIEHERLLRPAEPAPRRR